MQLGNSVTWDLKKTYFKSFIYLLIISFSLYASCVWAGPATVDSFVKTLEKTFQQFKLIMTGAAYLAGIGFSMIGLLKFKAHKDNPAQIPLSTPIALIAVSAGLLFLPTVFEIAGSAIFGPDAKSSLKTTYAEIR